MINGIPLSYFALLLFATCCIACHSTKDITIAKSQRVQEIYNNSNLLRESNNGIRVISAEEGKIIYSSSASQRFLPASTVKILTLSAALEYLDNRIPSLFYVESEDTLWIWGTGDPGFLNPTIDKESNAVPFLQQIQKKTIVFSDANFADQRYGSGWAWDDYKYAFQTERSPLPIYGNVVRFSRKKGGDLEISPSYFATQVQFDETSGSSIYRKEETNSFYFSSKHLASDFTLHRPFKTSGPLTAALLSEVFQKPIFYERKKFPTQVEQVKVIYTQYGQELYQQMMRESDNHIAEQLLLVIAAQNGWTLNSETSINRYMMEMDSLLNSTIRWVDGSGLSRYNLLSPQVLNQTLRHIFKKIGWKKIKEIFPAGGVNGTLKNNYAGVTRPYVYAKSGSMGGVQNLSGYLLTKKGKVLCFSMMQNNFVEKASAYKKEMEKILSYFYENY